MTQDAEILNTVLSELAKLKTKYDTENEKLNKINAIADNENLRETWCDDIVTRTDDIYQPYESEQLIVEKQKYLDMLEKSRNNAADKPQKKPIITYDFAYENAGIVATSAIAVFLIVLCILFNLIIPDRFTSVIVSLVETIVILGVATIILFILKIKDRITKYRNIKKKNAENLNFNNIEYPKLLSEYERRIEADEIDCKRARSKVLEAIDGCIPNIKRSAREVALKTAEIRNQIDDGKFSIFNIRDFSAKQLKTMAEYLKTGRADTYKEALNLYISETAEQEYRDKMLQKDKENKRKLSEAEKAKRNAEMSARIAERKAQQEAKKRDEEIKNLLKKLENK